MNPVRSHFPATVVEASKGGVMARSRSLSGYVDELVRVLRDFEPGEYSGEDCATLVKKFSRAEKALAAARDRCGTGATTSA
jgi:hypothetical protein